jgi:Holliday junction resolvase RusA-like endonuclease
MPKVVQKIILNLTPKTHVRATRGDSIFFRIPRDKLKPQGLKRLIRLEQYNAYKIELLAEAKKRKFQIPAAGLSITFYLPCPKTWSKKKKKACHGLLCQSRPDIDNLLKSFCDSLVSEDKFIASISATKRWVDFPSGWIECHLTEVEMQTYITPPVKE